MQRIENTDLLEQRMCAVIEDAVSLKLDPLQRIELHSTQHQAWKRLFKDFPGTDSSVFVTEFGPISVSVDRQNLDPWCIRVVGDKGSVMRYRWEDRSTA